MGVYTSPAWGLDLLTCALPCCVCMVRGHSWCCQMLGCCAAEEFGPGAFPCAIPSHLRDRAAAVAFFVRCSGQVPGVLPVAQCLQPCRRVRLHGQLVFDPCNQASEGGQPLATTLLAVNMHNWLAAQVASPPCRVSGWEISHSTLHTPVTLVKRDLNTPHC